MRAPNPVFDCLTLVSIPVQVLKFGLPHPRYSLLTGAVLPLFQVIRLC